jgi:hypothetical protein
MTISTAPGASLDNCPTCGRRITDTDDRGMEADNGQRWCIVHHLAELAERPRALDYDRLAPGTWGYWPVLCAVPDDLEVGDRVSFVGDDDGDIVAEVVKGPELRSWPCRIGYRTPAGELLTIGRMARGFRLDRWARHASLSRRGTR